MTTPPANPFPRAYLLQIYNQAITHGHILLHPITEPRAESLKASLYRLRRRSDRINASFITPEMRLVTVGNWRPDNGGTLPIFFTTSDETLPAITVAEGSPPSPAFSPPLANTNIPPLDELDPTEIDDYIANLLSSSHKQHPGSE